MGVDYGAMHRHFQDAVANPLPWRPVEHAPVQEVVHRSVDLIKLLPVPVHAEYDSGPYITAGIVVTANPETGVQNVSINRLQISGPSRIGALVASRGTGTYFEMAERAGKPLDVAIVIGADPLTLLASQALARFDQDELAIAGALHGHPLAVVKCLGNALHVPAQAEIVLEGRFLPGVREAEGPFGEFAQYYGTRDDRQVIEIDRVTHRRDAIFHTILGGGMEHILLGAVPREASILSKLQWSFPNVRMVQLSAGGVGRFHLHVQAKITHEAEGKNIILGAFAAHHDIKQVVVVDEDVDVTRPDQVEWAVATRFQSSRDLILIPESQAAKLDPTARSGVGSKMGFDATKPFGAEEMQFKRIAIPGEAEIDLARVISPVPAASWKSLLGAM
jgi:2,5-furandicarboxylate decarboxylase 1